MSEQLKVGDTVELNSGGPKLIISHIDKRGVWVEWVNGRKLESACFAPECLTLKAEASIQ